MSYLFRPILWFLIQIRSSQRTQGEVRIKGVDGQEFMVRPVNRSPLDVGKVELNPPLTADEIVRAVREGRERG